MMKIKTDTIVRLIVLLLALTNQTLTAMGKSPLPFEEETISELISILFTIGASAWAYWKNNSFTQAAIKADILMKQIKAEK